MPQLKINVTEVGHVFMRLSEESRTKRRGEEKKGVRRKIEELRSACVRRGRKRKRIKEREEWT